jgi:hypothetical protein
MGAVKTALAAFFAVSASVFESFCLEGSQTVRAGFFLSFVFLLFLSFALIRGLRSLPAVAGNPRVFKRFPNFRVTSGRISGCTCQQQSSLNKERKNNESTDSI